MNRWLLSGTVAAIYEEVVRRYLPRVAMGFWGFEVATLAANFGWKVGLPNVWLHGVCQLVQKKWGWAGFAAAVAYHVAWNRSAVLNGGAWWKFASAYVEGRDVAPGVKVGPIPAGTGVPGYTSTLSTAGDIRGTMEVRVDGEPVTPDEALELLGTDPRSFNCMYPVLITNGCLRQPANNEKNLLVALLERTHKIAFVGCDPREARKRTWKALTRVIQHMRAITPGLDTQYTIEECAAKMGSRGRRILEACQEDAKGSVAHLTKTISLKWNETLSTAKEMREEEPTMKPRAIVNLHPVIHSRMTQIARALSDRMHEIFNGQVFEIGGCAVEIFYAPGATQSDLDRIGRAMDSGRTVIAVSGDDSLMALGPLAFDLNGWMEADQGMFDQSQDELSLGFVAQMYRDIGVDEEFIQMFWYCCKASYAARRGRLQVKGDPGTQMPTGIVVTTPTNTLSTMAMLIYAIHHKNFDLEDVGKRLGFVVKVQVHQELGSATFLKGWWRRTMAGEPVWLPLPSALLKLGKILRNPREISRNPKGERVSDVEAARIVAKNMASCYGKVDYNYPLLGKFLFTLDRLGSEGTLTLPALESWKPAPRLDTVTVDVAEAEAAIVARYCVTVQEIEQVHSLFNYVEALPCYVEHPVFLRLRDVDYA